METPPLELEDHAFTPSNSKLISVFLRRRIAGEPLPPAAASHFHEADIYTAEPTTLTAGLDPVPAGKGEASAWLFFTPVKTKSTKDNRRCRRVGDGVGTWHSEHAPEAVVDDEGKRVGHRQLFSYKDKGGRRSGWSMWEFGAADQEGAEPLLVLCKIHQPKTASRRVDGSAARSARKRKAADDGVEQVSAPVKRRLFAPSPPPTPPAASQDKIGAASEDIPCPRTQIDESKDAPRSVLSLWDHWDEPATELGPIKPASKLGCSFSPNPGASRGKIISTTMESPATFLIPQPKESQGEMASFNCGFLMEGNAPPVPENFMDSSDANTPLSGSWNVWSCSSGGNAFLGGLPAHEEFGAGASGSWTGYNTTASCSGGNALFSGFPTHDSQVISGFSGVQYGCDMPSATFLPSAVAGPWSMIRSLM
jgi:hypothetical protein